MKRLFALLLVLVLGATISTTALYAQDPPADNDGDPTEQVEEGTPEEGADTAATLEETPEAAPEETGADVETADAETEKVTFYQQIKKYYIDGGWEFMTFVLVCLILGLAVAIERIITLSLATINTKKLLTKIEDHVRANDIAGAHELCKATPGPTAEVLGEGLRRVDNGLDAVEKAIVSNGSVQMGLLEKGLVWLALFIALAPMLGFMGTVIGMISAFDAIEAAGDIRPSDVAGGIKVALLTTVFGLITAIILQIFYNLITNKVDSLSNKMEDATISMIDILLDNGYNNNGKEA
ncbi:MotA/TolQ/ExbB proton channel family protein [Saprospira grandis]|uniref:MotA/TolQ/ExbB proton channel family protein n=1 Tax=Saprospira grandis TaxID=1008 RepID=UPI0022DE92B7|nr:MotA/TolQ/ExbB proton channel family protein [Saprospira grandis]WBM75499.1 MotA/TolQ/ExbB proton channel family protein [Saprospira grandis]